MFQSNGIETIDYGLDKTKDYCLVIQTNIINSFKIG